MRQIEEPCTSSIASSPASGAAGICPIRAKPEGLFAIRFWLSVETSASRRAGTSLCVGALVALFVVILCLGNRLAHDEAFHLTTVKALFRLGLSREFFMGTPWSTPGPLYAFLQGACAWLTGLRPPGIRLVNLACVAGVIVLVTRTLHARNVAAPASVALGILAAPMGWIVFGLAMTEAPAMLCAATGLWLTVLWQREAPSRRRDLLALGAGLGFGAAVTGRQVYLAALPSILLLARRGTLRPVCLQLAAAVPLPAALFIVWGGLIPPEMRFIGQGYRVTSAILSYGYTGLTALLLAPRFFDLGRTWMLSVIGLMLACDLVGGPYLLLPLEFLLGPYIPVSLRHETLLIGGAVMISLAGLFVAASLKQLWVYRDDRFFVFSLAAVLALALTPVKIVHMWDIRYVAVVLPLLVVVLPAWTTHNYARVLRLAAGMVCAAMFLHYYSHVRWNEEHLPTMREHFSRSPWKG